MASFERLCPRPGCFICKRFDGAGRQVGTSTLTYSPCHVPRITRGTLCATAHLTKWVFGVCLGGPAKRAGHKEGKLNVLLLSASTVSVAELVVKLRGTDAEWLFRHSPRRKRLDLGYC